MDIIEMKEILTELNSVGISRVVFEPTENGTLLRGTNDLLNVLVYYEVPVKFSEHNIGIYNVGAILSRINLFDQEKAQISLTESGEGWIGEINIKQGRKKASYRCHRIDRGVPSVLPGDLSITEDNAVMFTKEYVDYLMNAFSAMSQTGNKEKQTISLDFNGSGEVKIAVYDGEDDSFNDEIELDESCTIKKTKGYFEIVPFQRVIKKSVVTQSNDGHAIFTVTSEGIGVFKLEFIDVLVHPMVS